MLCDDREDWWNGLEKEDLLGCVVISKCGRDKGRRFVIIGFACDDLVLISDGKLRKVEKPKKKKLKHLLFTSDILDNVREEIKEGCGLVNSNVKKGLREIAPISASELRGV